ncbi:tagaturonate reductase [Larkinella knui]|uniref:Tagaturonate reductase n=1 Tax=Larkinella knui TaxID=2025310 RepID=A0A3P1CKX1_9BACT|nr:tagaturonate reductase [Larkinella knui]RRB13957.1 tagaturonate reductase [Larkinella knui]
MTPLNRSNHPATIHPERVLQFGTGVLLRGLPDYLIHKANEQGIFNGSIVVVKSTGGATDEFAEQDSLYTVVTRGIQKGQSVDKHTVVSAISRVISAQDDWKTVLDVAKKPTLQIIISNTTEVGIQYVAESIFQNPPQSYPAKLTAFLYERFKNFGGGRSKGLVVIPTELITDNGLKLRDIVEKVAKHNELGKLFMKWLKYHVRFCNSLVDRIVPGKPDAESMQQQHKALGYEDKLLIMAEPYRLWAIEGDDRVKSVLSFAKADPNVIIDEDINFYRERKLRVLNGGHTISVPLAYLLGLETVNEMMQHPLMGRFVEEVITQEIVTTLPQWMIPEEKPDAVREFAADVLDRFRNPYIEHLLLSITLQETSKMRARNLPTIQRYLEQQQQVPQRMALGFAAYLRFMKAVRLEKSTYLGETALSTGGIVSYPIRDDYAEYFYTMWQKVDVHDAASVRNFVHAICDDSALWETDLSVFTGFADAVSEHLNNLLTLGIEATLERQMVSAESTTSGSGID